MARSASRRCQCPSVAGAAIISAKDKVATSTKWMECGINHFLALQYLIKLALPANNFRWIRGEIMAFTTADNAGVGVGNNVVRPFMNDQNTKQNVAAFAKKFCSWFDNDKATALAKYEFGAIGKNGDIPFTGTEGKNAYISDAMGVGPHVKKLLRETLVDNYFSGEPQAMRFSIGVTSRAGGDLEVGIKKNADGDVFIDVRILCMKPGP
jgi:hypothetical protein